MTEFLATYRLQFRSGMTFAKAAELVPYLADLGVSHLYASPIFAAVPGSTHGYDVVDHQQFDPGLGGEEGFRLLSEAMRDHGLGLLLDIVPNHMAAHTANPWWHDLLTHGQDSAYAHCFDIDWRAPRLLLPLLAEPYGEALAAGHFSLVWHQQSDEVQFRYRDLHLPLHPASLGVVCGANLDRRTAVERVNRNPELLHALHEAQVWRLAHWRLARAALSYRRFFEITDLVGVRVEDPRVFAAVHALPLRLLREGSVDRLRIDHIDGLADPKTYLFRLREASGRHSALVEKILGPEEGLPEDWACAGTTGYEMGAMLTALQVDPAGEPILTEAWCRFTGAGADYAAALRAAKRQILTDNLAAELTALVGMMTQIAAEDTASRDLPADSLRKAIIELLIALPVYRTYIDTGGPSQRDRRLLLQAAREVVSDRRIEDRRALGFIVNLLLQPVKEDPWHGGVRRTFIQRFQQTSGPLMAKAVEDTLFYRFNRLIALNEVGAEPVRFGLDSDRFHEAMRRRQAQGAGALSATATHDTKRGEDARARLAVLSEMPSAWAEAVERWRAAASPLWPASRDSGLPDRSVEWLFYQALLGAWPPELALDNEAGLQDLAERSVGFMIKAMREAKEHTSWTAPNRAYERGVEVFVRGLFSPAQRPLLRDIRATIAQTETAGVVNSLAQLTLKLTLPGVPDIYQGTELYDFSMVDPDNRRPVDFVRRMHLLEEAKALTATQVIERWREGLPKLWLLTRLLGLRQARRALFQDGRYEPLRVEGDEAQHVLAFSRSLPDSRLVVAVPRLVLRHLLPGQLAWSPGAFARTFLCLSSGSVLRMLSGRRVPDGRIALDRLWRDFPVAVAWTDAGT